jgi:hypothetical protein
MFRDFYRQLSEEDIRFIKSQDWTEEGALSRKTMWPESEDSVFGKAVQEIAPLVFLRHLDGVSSTFWFDRNETDRLDRQRYQSKSTSLPVSEESIEFENQPSVLQDLSVSPRELIRHREPLCVPHETELIVGYPSSERRYSRILFEKKDYFEIEIGFFRPDHMTTMGLPIGYPGYVESESSPMSEGLTIFFEATFGFPDIEDKDIDLHQTFADGWVSYLKENWDWKRFIDKNPDRAVYKIQQRLDEIEELLTDPNQNED